MLSNKLAWSLAKKTKRVTLTSANAVKQIGIVLGKKKRVTLTSANVVKQVTGLDKKKQTEA